MDLKRGTWKYTSLTKLLFDKMDISIMDSIYIDESGDLGDKGSTIFYIIWY